MKIITQEIRNEWYKRMDEATLDLYQSNGLWLREVFATTGLLEEQYRDFVLPVGDVLMGLMPHDKLIPMLMLQLGVDHSVAEGVSLAVSKYFIENPDVAAVMKRLTITSSPEQTITTAEERLQAMAQLPSSTSHSITTEPPMRSHTTPTLVGEVPDADSAIRDELLLKPRVMEKIVDRAVPEPGAKPLTREDILRSLAAKRTLASDVSALQQNDGQ